MALIKIKQAVVVEGKYDKMRLKEFCDALIITTDGFRIFKDREKKEFLKALAERQGLLIITDSDRAGFVIRSHLKSFIPNEYIKNVYIPEILGKERRKTTPSKEGLLGVEGIDNDILINILKDAAEVAPERSDPITKLDLYDLGISGKGNSSYIRRRLSKELSLPSRLSSNALLEVLNAMFTREEFFDFVEPLDKEF